MKVCIQYRAYWLDQSALKSKRIFVIEAIWMKHLNNTAHSQKIAYSSCTHIALNSILIEEDASFLFCNRSSGLDSENRS